MVFVRELQQERGRRDREERVVCHCADERTAAGRRGGGAGGWSRGYMPRDPAAAAADAGDWIWRRIWGGAMRGAAAGGVWRCLPEGALAGADGAVQADAVAWLRLAWRSDRGSSGIQNTFSPTAGYQKEQVITPAVCAHLPGARPTSLWLPESARAAPGSQAALAALPDAQLSPLRRSRLCERRALARRGAAACAGAC